MLLYNLWLAQKSVRRNVILSCLIVAGVALGVALSTLFAAIRHAYAQDPFPDRSDSVYYVRLDNWDPLREYTGAGKNPLPPQLTYRDALELLKSKIPTQQSAAFEARLSVIPDPTTAKPLKAPVRMTTAGFFRLFPVPFKFGSAWDEQADAASEQVIVISSEMNQLAFGGQDSVGRSLRIEDREFRVVGVLDAWRPPIRYYDPHRRATSAPELIFMPFALQVPMQIQTAGNGSNWLPSAQPGFEGELMSELNFIQFWVELRTSAQRDEYAAFLNAYILEQKHFGRFLRPVNYRITPMQDYLEERGVVPAQTTTLVIVGFLFLVVCALNLMGLLLSKFLARSAEVGVRRALGARRRDVFVQLLLECEILALAGGALGVGLSFLGLRVANAWILLSASRSDLFRLDLPILGVALASAIAAGFLAGAYPALRICRLPPARHLKLQ